MQSDRIKELIKDGEGETVEFKQGITDPDKLAQTIVAFNNTMGGNILLGVNDAGIVAGIKDGDKVEQWITNIARNNVRPPLVPTMQTVEVSGKEVLAVHIPKGEPRQTSKGKFYIRVGPTNRPADVSEVRALFEKEPQIPVDVNVLLTATRRSFYEVQLTIINTGHDGLSEIEVSCYPSDLLKVKKPFKISKLEPGKSTTVIIASEVSDNTISLNYRRSIDIRISALDSQGRKLLPVGHKVMMGELKADWERRLKDSRQYS